MLEFNWFVCLDWELFVLVFVIGVKFLKLSGICGLFICNGGLFWVCFSSVFVRIVSEVGFGWFLVDVGNIECDGIC